MSATADDVRYAAGWHDGWLAALADAREKIEVIASHDQDERLWLGDVREALAAPAPSRPLDDERADADLVEGFGAHPDFVVESTDSVPAPSREEQQPHDADILADGFLRGALAEREAVAKRIMAAGFPVSPELLRAVMSE